MQKEVLLKKSKMGKSNGFLHDLPNRGMGNSHYKSQQSMNNWAQVSQNSLCNEPDMLSNDNIQNDIQQFYHERKYQGRAQKFIISKSAIKT